MIKIIETGGVYKPKDREGRDLPETELKFGGIPVVRQGEHLVLFFDEFVGPQVKGAYVPLGVFQGKFKIEGSKAIQQAPNEYALKNSIPLDVANLKAKIKEIKSNI